MYNLCLCILRQFTMTNNHTSNYKKLRALSDFIFYSSIHPIAPLINALTSPLDIINIGIYKTSLSPFFFIAILITSYFPTIINNFDIQLQIFLSFIQNA